MFGDHIQGCVCADVIGVCSDMVLARVAAHLLDGEDEDGVGVGARAGEGGVDLRDWQFIAKQPASAPHMLRIVPHTGPRVRR